MKRLIYKSNLRRDRMPEWLRFIIAQVLERYNGIALTGSLADFMLIRVAVDAALRELKVKNPVGTRLAIDEGEMALFIERSGRVLISIYIK